MLFDQDNLPLWNEKPTFLHLGKQRPEPQALRTNWTITRTQGQTELYPWGLSVSSVNIYVPRLKIYVNPFAMISINTSPGSTSLWGWNTHTLWWFDYGRRESSNDCTMTPSYSVWIWKLNLLKAQGSISQRVRTSIKRYTNCEDSPKLRRVIGPNSR